MAKFKGPEGTTSVSVGGETFNLDDKGCIVVPDTIEGAAAALVSHGFTVVRDEKAEAAARKAAEAEAKKAAEAGNNTPAA